MSRSIFRLPRRRISFFVIPSLLISLIFIIYQISIFYQLLANTPSPKVKEQLVKGTHVQEKRFYTPNRGKFSCIKSGEVIDFSKVNDNYCDCLDGTDEPGTNACPNGVFHCSDTSLKNTFPKMVESSKVNDGICDCCDGSDEFQHNHVLKTFDRNLQRSMGHFLVPCPNRC